MGLRSKALSIKDNHPTASANRKILRSECKSKEPLKSNTTTTRNAISGENQTARAHRTRSQSQSMLIKEQTTSRPELKRTRSMMFETSSPASLTQLMSAPRKRRRSIRLSCDFSDSGDSGLGDSAASTGREDGFSSPVSPLTPQDDLKPLSLIIHNSFTTRAEQTNLQNPTSSDGLLTLTCQSLSQHPKPSNEISTQKIYSETSSELLRIHSNTRSRSLSNPNEKRKSVTSERQTARKGTDVRKKVRSCSVVDRRRDAGRLNNRHRLSKNEARLEARRKRASYMARRLNPHLQSPERDQPKKLARRSLTSVVHEHRSHSVNIYTASPRKRRVRPNGDIQKMPVKPIDTTRTAPCEEDSGVGSDDQSSDISACNWKHCKCIVSSKELVDHLKKVHVANQTLHNKVYRCYWDGCKVFDKKAKSLLWLEGHVMKHLGPKPHYCIYPECTARFSTNETLMKHVESHIKTEISKTTPSKLNQTNRKCIKTRRHIRMRILRQSEKCLVPRPDYFTHDIVEYIKWEEKTLREKWGSILTDDRQHFHFTAQITGLCTTVEGVQKVLLSWSPEEFKIPDSWHPITDPIAQNLTKQVKIGSLPQHIVYSY